MAKQRSLWKKCHRRIRKSLIVKFSEEAEKDPSLEDLARAELKKVQDGEEENTKLWKEFITESLKEYNKLYERLDVHFDTYYGESFYNDNDGRCCKRIGREEISSWWWRS